MEKEFGILHVNYVGQGNIEELTAKEMFERLGYKKNDWNEFTISYTRKKPNKSQTSTIEFDINCKIIRTQSTDYGVVKSKQLTIQQLKAINQQCKELGWL